MDVNDEANIPDNPSSGASPAPPTTAPATSSADAAGPRAATPGTAGASAPAATSVAPTSNPNFGQRILQSIVGALGGSDETTVKRNDDGTLSVTSGKSGPGQSAKRIIAAALTGAASGAAVAPGPANLGRAAAAGFGSGAQMASDRQQAQTKQADEDFEYRQKATAFKANQALIQQDLATKTFALQRNKQEVDDRDIQNSNEMQKLISSDPSNYEIGTYKDADAFFADEKNHPEIARLHAQGQLWIGRGKDGLHVIRTTPEWGEQKNDEPVKIHWATGEIDKNGQPVTREETIPAGAMKNKDISQKQQASAKDMATIQERTFTQSQENQRAKEREAGENQRAETREKGENIRSAQHEAGEWERAALKAHEAEAKGDPADRKIQSDAISAAAKMRPMVTLLDSAEKYYQDGKKPGKHYDSAGDLSLIVNSVRAMNPGSVRLPQRELEMEIKRGTYGQQAQRWYQTKIENGTLPTQFRDELMSVVRRETTMGAESAARNWNQVFKGQKQLPDHLQRFGVAGDTGGNGGAAGGGFFGKFGGKTLQTGNQ